MKRICRRETIIPVIALTFVFSCCHVLLCQEQAPLPMPGQEQAPLPHPGCDPCKVHIFLLNGFCLLPHGWGKMNELGGRLKAQGYCNVTFGNHYHKTPFTNQIRRLHAEDPQARFLLVGYSYSGPTVYGIAQSVAADGIPVDLLMFIDSYPSPACDARPATVCRMINVVSAGILLHGQDMTEAENFHLDDCGHMYVPLHPMILAFVTEVLDAICDHPEGSTPLSGKVRDIYSAAFNPAPLPDAERKLDQAESICLYDGGALEAQPMRLADLDQILAPFYADDFSLLSRTFRPAVLPQQARGHGVSWGSD